jgi:phytoene dehydrogenase-like protein
MEPCDVAIIGAGHNGLVCAAYLAGAGLSVHVLEKNASVGGAVATEAFHPGFRNSLAAYTVSLLNPRVIADLGLKAHGLSIVRRPVANFWPIDERRYLLLPYGAEARREALAGVALEDAERLGDYEAALERAAQIVRPLLLLTPPNAGGGLRAIGEAVRLATAVLARALPEKRILLDLATKSAADFLGQWFDSSIVKAAFAFDGVVGAYASPYTAGTAYVLLHHCLGEVDGAKGVWGHAIGGMGAISRAIEAAATTRGARITKEAPVQGLLIEHGRAAGVRLASGAVVRARAVAAAVPPKLLFRDLVPPGCVAEEVHRRMLGLKSGSGSFRMNVALAELPSFRCRPGALAQDHHASGIIIGPTLEYLDRAYLDARAHGWSRAPIIEMLIPSTLDPTLAPAGRHVASLFVQHVAPQLPEGRSWDDAKDAFADLVIDTVNAWAPNFKASIIARQVLSPLDLERRFGMVDGDIFHGQLTQGQLFSARPLLGHADYRMPVPGLYLCGSGAHPGGGVTGLPGRNAAHEILRDLKGARWRWPGAIDFWRAKPYIG